MSDDAVFRATGKRWDAWFAILDEAGARGMTHTAIADHLHRKHGVPGWWNQMVAVNYEQARGLREKYQSCDGDFSASSSKTVAAPLSKLFAAWENEKARARWMPDPGFTVRKATAKKSMRITWVDGKTNVEVNFYAKGAGKSMAAVQHSNLKDAKDVERKKAYWSRALGTLKERLEG